MFMHKPKMVIKQELEMFLIFMLKLYDNNGYKNARMNACGYSLGSTFSPNWMDWPMLYTGNPYVIQLMVMSSSCI